MLEREKDEAMRSAIFGLLRARLIFDWRARLRSELLGSGEENTTGWKVDLVLTDNRFCD